MGGGDYCECGSDELLRRTKDQCSVLWETTVTWKVTCTTYTFVLRLCVWHCRCHTFAYGRGLLFSQFINLKWQPKETKKRIGRVMIESEWCYESQVWSLNSGHKLRMTAVGLDYPRISARISTKTNEEIGNPVYMRKTVIEKIERSSDSEYMRVSCQNCGQNYCYCYYNEDLIIISKLLVGLRVSDKPWTSLLESATFSPLTTN